MGEVLLLAFHRDVGLRKNADERVVLIDDGQTAHLIARHQLKSLERSSSGRIVTSSRLATSRTGIPRGSFSSATAG